MSSDIAISVRNLTKTYRLFAHPGDRIKQAATFGLRKYHKEFTALKGVSFDIRKGETVGIIGRNGSGKSTLLQLICGVLRPTSGAIQVNGRISALLELGAGFNPEFTGRENVYFQGALMGLGKEEMDRRFDTIAAFADIGEFIEQPVRMYSSGMFVRLAFATAVHVDADILVIDEALAVGDELFQRKCYVHLRQLAEQGCTVLFVSHASAMINALCNRVALLDQGRLVEMGAPAQLLGDYQRLLHEQRPRVANAAVPEEDSAPPSRIVYAPLGARISAVALTRPDGTTVGAVGRSEACCLRIVADFDAPAAHVRAAAMIKTKEGFELGGVASHATGREIPEIQAGERRTFVLPFTCRLLPGTYFLSCSVLSGDQPLHRIIDACSFRVEEEGSLPVHGIVDFSAEVREASCQIPGPA